jgi:hypothetical protein
MHRPLLPLTAAALTCLLTAATPALADDHGHARAHDRDHDGMSDTWERRHHVDRPRSDPDRDGLPNLSEYRAGTDPHRADTDRDGVADGRERRAGTNPRRPDLHEPTGTVSTIDDGTVTLTLRDGRVLTARVAPQTRITCEDDSRAPVARVASHGGPGPSSNSGPVNGSGSSGHEYDYEHEYEYEHPYQHEYEPEYPYAYPSAPVVAPAPAPAPVAAPMTPPAAQPCALTPGATVLAAEIELTPGGPVFEEIELLRAS